MNTCRDFSADVSFAFIRVWIKFGIATVVIIKIIATTIRSSRREKPRSRLFTIPSPVYKNYKPRASPQFPARLSSQYFTESSLAKAATILQKIIPRRDAAVGSLGTVAFEIFQFRISATAPKKPVSAKSW